MPARTPHASTDYDVDSVLSGEGRAIRFACTGCGKCCTDTPMMSMAEAFELADLFLAGPLIRFSPLREDIHDTGHPFFEAADSLFPVYIELHAKPIAWTGHNRRCTFLLDDMKCGIYERRPAICRVVPFDMHLRPDLISRSPVFDEALARKLDLACDWSESAPIIVTPDGVVDPVTRKAYEAGREKTGLSQDLIRIIPPDYLDKAWAKNKAQMRRGEDLDDFHLPFPPFVAAAVALGWFDTGRAKAILTAQIALADRLEADALRRKDKAERDMTKVIRLARQQCQQMLPNLRQSIAEAALLLCDDDEDAVPDVADEAFSLDTVASLAERIVGDVGNPGPSDGRWRDWQDAAWGGFLSRMGWHFDYRGKDAPDGPAFRIGLPDGRTVEAWTVEQNPVPDLMPDADDWTGFHGDYRRKAGTDGILVLPIEPGRWERKRRKTTFLGWWLPPDAGRTTPWRRVFARGASDRTDACADLGMLIEQAAEDIRDGFAKADEAAAADVDNRFHEAALAAESDGYPRMFTRMFGARLAEMFDGR